ncbi:L,D-transpeptidase family protein [Streptomyces sp. OF3]|uniref:L,D-transpeptidase family protein n=1 Tax=Streptomyces alkaliterrae TaxID=2213162 RepID=A0A5P0YQ64_9ACTN|nr:L,D-transpeptidase family protein [Streptomyces alkaliterrae]MBB1259256.1 L,D-transpeptidase family protein [Streptomyces alkaliterrae]MQS02398.1 L,D-transpeptidase family protein [Streptomyces alkaliterrae]
MRRTFRTPPRAGAARRTGPGRVGGPLVAVSVVVALLAGGAVLAAGTPASAGGTAEEECTAGTGPYQRQLEAHLGLPVDGRQSEADCRAIREFQRRHRLDPADGYAGVPAYRMMLVEQAKAEPNKEGRCPSVSRRTTCVDLSRQLLWVQTGARDRLVFDVVPVRTGRLEMETRGGLHHVYWRNRHHHSTLYDVPMPYAQFFDGGQALHGTTEDLFESGSAGCVNLHNEDAAKLWDLLRLEDRVFVFGVKPGTQPRSAGRTVDAHGRSLLGDDALVAEGMRFDRLNRLRGHARQAPLPETA